MITSLSVQVGETKTVRAVPANAAGVPTPFLPGTPAPQWPLVSGVGLLPSADGLTCAITGVTPGLVNVGCGVLSLGVGGVLPVTVTPAPPQQPTQILFDLA